MRADIVPGAIFPDYELPDHTGTKRKLSALQGQDPMVLMLARGGYCPNEHLQHTRLVEMEREIRAGYCRLVTISTDSVLQSLEWRTRLDARWPFLSDEERLVQRDLDIVEYTDPHHNAMIPHTVVLEPGLRIYKIYNGYWPFGRPSNEELRQDLRALSMRYRPDWDLATPGLREAWERGDKSRFWPYRS